MSTIAIHDIGPITEFECDLQSPGLYVLKGKHGSGKSVTLRTVELAANGRTTMEPTKRDGAKRGEAVVFGKTLRIAKQVREEGELSVDGLGDLNIADLHTPRFDRPETRDKHRIKALLRVAGVEADATLFHPLFGGKERFERIVDADALKTDDLVEMTARVKRATEKRALAVESDASTALARERAAREIAEGVDTNRPHDEKALADQLAAAIEMRGRVTAARQAGLTAQQKAQQARQRLAALPPGAISVNEATEALDAADAKLADAEKRVNELSRQLEEARGFREVMATARGAAYEALRNAKNYAQLRAELETTIKDSGTVECPTEAEVAEAGDAVAKAQDAQAVGLSVRQAIAARDKADAYSAEAKDHAKLAERLRHAARDTQDVLSEAIARIPNCPLRVKTDDDGNARLVTATDRSDAEPFDDLSDGERWPLLIGLAALKNRLIVLPQAAFGELADSTRDAIDQLAKQHECIILTAQVDDAELRCEAWSGAEAVAV